MAPSEPPLFITKGDSSGVWGFMYDGSINREPRRGSES